MEIDEQFSKPLVKSRFTVTVDGKNLAPVETANVTGFKRFSKSRVVQDFFHQ